jgi:predicted acyl esterase
MQSLLPLTHVVGGVSRGLDAVLGRGHAHQPLECGFSCTPYCWYRSTILEIHFFSIVGWYDIFLGPMLKSFENFQFKSSSGAKGQQKLIVGPRGHCVATKDKYADDFIAFHRRIFYYLFT